MSLSADAPRPRPAPGPRVLRGTMASRLRSAETVAKTPRLQAVADEDAIEAAVAKAVEAARAEAYAEGYAAAESDAEAERHRAVAAAAARLCQAAEALATTRESLVAEVSEDALSLTYELARTIIGDEAVAASLPPASVVARALRLAPEGEDLLVRVPAQSELSAADLVGLVDTARISIREDPAVEPGGCVVEAGACRIDNQISTALERVRKVLAETRGTDRPVVPAEEPGA